MSDGFRITVGVLFAIGAGCFGLIGMGTAVFGGETLVRVILFHVLAVFFLSLALACFWERSRPVTVRIVGGLLFLAAVAFIVHDVARLQAGEVVELRQLLGFPLAFGLPGLYLLVTAGYPIWGRHSHLFYQRDSREEERAPPDEWPHDSSPRIRRPPTYPGRP